MVDCGSLESCCGRKPTVGSNPTSSAIFFLLNKAADVGAHDASARRLGLIARMDRTSKIHEQNYR